MYGHKSNQMEQVMNINMSNQYMFQMGNSSFAKEAPPWKPVGVFWDIENCAIPRGTSICVLVNKIRSIFTMYNFLEREFAVVGDVYGVNNHVISDLNSMQLNFIHVCSYAKNAGDEKLKQMIHRFLMIWGQNSAIILLTSDINFAPLLSDIVHRIGCFVILFHHTKVSPALISCAHLTMNFDEFCKQIPFAPSFSEENTVATYLTVTNWPVYFSEGDLRAFLNLLTDNCGGRIIDVDVNLKEAIMVFRCKSDAERCAQKVINRRYLGNTLKVSTSYTRPAKLRQNQNRSQKTEQPVSSQPVPLLQSITAPEKQIPKSSTTFQETKIADSLSSKKSSSKTVTFENTKGKVLNRKSRKKIANAQYQKDRLTAEDGTIERLFQVFQLLDMLNNRHENNCDCLISFPIEYINEHYNRIFGKLTSVFKPKHPKSLEKVLDQLLTRLYQKSASKYSLFLVYMSNEVYLQKCDSHWIDTQVVVLFKILFESSSQSLTWKQLMTQFHDELGYKLGPGCLRHLRFQEVVHLVKGSLNNCLVKLSPLYEFAAMIMSVMLKHSDSISTKWDTDKLESEYYDHFGIFINVPTCFAAKSYKSLIERMDLIFATNKHDARDGFSEICIKHPELISNFSVKHIPTCNYCENTLTDQLNDSVNSDDIELFEMEGAPTVNMFAC